LRIPADSVGFFGVLQDFDGPASKWGLQCYFDLDNAGFALAAGTTFNFTYQPGTWIPVSVVIDLDNDYAELYINEVLRAEWQWSLDHQGELGTRQLGALDFFAWDSDQRKPKAYIDQVVYSGLDPLEAPSNLTASVTGNDVTLAWEAPVQDIPLGYKIYRDEDVIEPLVTGLTYLDDDLYPGVYSYALKAVYSSGLSTEAGPVSATVAGGTARKYVLLEIATGTWCTYCPGSAMAADDLVSNGQQVAVIEYHDNDSYSNVYSDYRNSYYNVPGFPTAHFDGGHQFAGGSATQSLYPEYYQNYALCAEKLSVFTLGMSLVKTGENSLDVEVTAKKIYSYPDNPIRLNVVLTESHIPEEWQVIMDEVNYVCREMYPDQYGILVEFGDDSTFSANYSIEIDTSFEYSNCQLVAFLQDSQTHEVLQTDMASPGTLGIDQMEEVSLHIYPNPALDRLYVNSEKVVGNLKILDLSGREIQNLNVGLDKFDVNVSFLAPGIYMIILHTSAGEVVRKFIK
jgi:hypothetical protein